MNFEKFYPKLIVVIIRQKFLVNSLNRILFFKNNDVENFIMFVKDLKINFALSNFIVILCRWLNWIV